MHPTDHLLSRFKARKIRRTPQGRYKPPTSPVDKIQCVANRAIGMHTLRVIGIIFAPVGGADDMPNGTHWIDGGVAGGRSKCWPINSELVGEKVRGCLFSAVTLLPFEADHDD